eukprot:gb/GECG01016401.1/.p1 GENE.gb/GECG01016401.1/~~gb/GECG01016401.1/.p1  ORF type:complete len:759 (+),score=87.81 gb/GECG01016401.1/:1-2277(+)
MRRMMDARVALRLVLVVALLRDRSPEVLKLLKPNQRVMVERAKKSTHSRSGRAKSSPKERSTDGRKRDSSSPKTASSSSSNVNKKQKKSGEKHQGNLSAADTSGTNEMHSAHDHGEHTDAPTGFCKWVEGVLPTVGVTLTKQVETLKLIQRLKIDWGDPYLSALDEAKAIFRGPVGTDDQVRLLASAAYKENKRHCGGSAGSSTGSRTGDSPVRNLTQGMSGTDPDGAGGNAASSSAASGAPNSRTDTWTTELSKFVGHLGRIPFRTDVKRLSGCYLPGAKSPPNGKLFIRPVYHELYDVLQAYTNTKFTIEGTPGIGKTMMIPYTIWRLLHEKTPPRHVFFCPHRVRGSAWKIDGDGVAEISIDILRHTVTKGDFVLVDGTVSGEIGGIASLLVNLDKAKLVAFISPRKSNRVALANESLVRLVMPPLELPELLQCHKLSYQKKTKRADVLKRFKEAGGVPRYVFWDPDYTAIKSELQHLDVDTFIKYSGEIRDEVSTEDGRYRILHPFPGCTSSDDPTTDMQPTFRVSACVIRFASTKVKDHALLKWRRQQWVDVAERIWKEGQSVDLGDLFETACHRMIPQETANRGPISLTIQKLGKLSRSWERLGDVAAVTLLTASKNDFDQVSEIKRLITSAQKRRKLQGVYAKPIYGYFPSIDAFIIPRDTKESPIFFQYTIGQRHTLIMRGVLEVWEKLKTAGFAFPVFYFVVPDYQKDAFQPANPVYSNGDKGEVEKELFESMTFYVVSVTQREMKKYL